jgi:hypothetical protein
LDGYHIFIPKVEFSLVRKVVLASAIVAPVFEAASELEFNAEVLVFFCAIASFGCIAIVANIRVINTAAIIAVVMLTADTINVLFIIIILLLID